MPPASGAACCIDMAMSWTLSLLGGERNRATSPTRQAMRARDAALRLGAVQPILKRSKMVLMPLTATSTACSGVMFFCVMLASACGQSCSERTAAYAGLYDIHQGIDGLIRPASTATGRCGSEGSCQ